MKTALLLIMPLRIPRDSGKENGNYYNVLGYIYIYVYIYINIGSYRAYMMEKRTETTTLY